VLQVLLIASPGFVASDFVQYAMTFAARQEDRILLENRQKMLVTRSASGHKSAVEEVLGNPEVLSQLADVHAAEEVSSSRNALYRVRMRVAADPSWSTRCADKGAQ